MVDLTLELHDKFQKHKLIATKQSEADATYSIWRDEEDYFINWNWTVDRIIRHIDALGYPYAGSRTSIGDQLIIIDEAEPVEDIKFVIRQPGKIWKLENGHPVVVCGKGCLKIIKARDAQNTPYIFKFLRRTLKSGNQQIQES